MNSERENLTPQPVKVLADFFDQLVKGVRDMKCHTAGKAVRGAVVTNVGAPDDPLNAEVKTIRETALTSRS